MRTRTAVPALTNTTDADAAVDSIDAASDTRLHGTGEQRRRKILLLSPAFPPAPFAGSLRANNVARALAARGHSVHVVTTAQGAPERIDVPGDGKLRVHAVTPLPGIKQLYRALRKYFRSSPEQSGVATAPAPASAASMPRIKRYVLSLLAVPDDETGFILPAVARGLSAPLRGFDLIYSTAPPFSAHLAGLLLRRLTGVRWIMEYRDPWNGNMQRDTDITSRPSEAMNRWLERLCLRSADRVVGVSQGIRDIVARQAPLRNDVMVIRNGIDAISPRPAPPSGAEPFRLLYMGTLYIDRDPRPFIRAVGMLRRKLDLTPAELVIDFVGRCRTFNGISVEGFAAAEGVGDLLRFTDWLPHERARERIDSADLLLLFAQAQPAQVPNKLYEYLGSRRPIFALAEAESESAALLRCLPGNYLVTDFEPNAIMEALERAFATRDRRDDAADDEPALRELTTEAQMARLIEQLQL